MYSEGLFKCKATAWGLTETSNGHPKFGMNFDVIGHIDSNRSDASPLPCEPGTGRWTITVTDNSADWLIQTVQHLGYDRDDLLGLDPDSDNAFNFEGVDFIAKCKHEEYQGRQQEKWSVVLPPKKLSASKLAELNERMARKVKEAKERQVAKQVAQKTEAAKQVTETAKVGF